MYGELWSINHLGRTQSNLIWLRGVVHHPKSDSFTHNNNTGMSLKQLTYLVRVEVMDEESEWLPPGGTAEI